MFLWGTPSDSRQGIQVPCTLLCGWCKFLAGVPLSKDGQFIFEALAGAMAEGEGVEGRRKRLRSD